MAYFSADDLQSTVNMPRFCREDHTTDCFAEHSSEADDREADGNDSDTDSSDEDMDDGVSADPVAHARAVAASLRTDGEAGRPTSTFGSGGSSAGNVSVCRVFTVYTCRRLSNRPCNSWAHKYRLEVPFHLRIVVIAIAVYSKTLHFHFFVGEFTFSDCLRCSAMCCNLHGFSITGDTFDSKHIMCRSNSHEDHQRQQH